MQAPTLPFASFRQEPIPLHLQLKERQKKKVQEQAYPQKKKAQEPGPSRPSRPSKPWLRYPPQPSKCRYCNHQFDSKNKLFQHLEQCKPPSKATSQAPSTSRAPSTTPKPRSRAPSNPKSPSNPLSRVPSITPSNPSSQASSRTSISATSSANSTTSIALFEKVQLQILGQLNTLQKKKRQMPDQTPHSTVFYQKQSSQASTTLRTPPYVSSTFTPISPLQTSPRATSTTPTLKCPYRPAYSANYIQKLSPKASTTLRSSPRSFYPSASPRTTSANLKNTRMPRQTVRSTVSQPNQSPKAYHPLPTSRTLNHRTPPTFSNTFKLLKKTEKVQMDIRNWLQQST